MTLGAYPSRGGAASARPAEMLYAGDVELRTEIEINAPAARVYAALTDFASYPDWNPYVKSLEGELVVGSKLRLVVSTGDGSERVVRARWSRVEPDRVLGWESTPWLRGWLDGRHFFELFPLDPGRTRLVHGEDLSGRLVQHMGRRLTSMARGFVGMNEALRRRVE